MKEPEKNIIQSGYNNQIFIVGPVVNRLAIVTCCFKHD
jgi:hypothetical protein